MHEGIASLHNLMHGQRDRHDENEAGQKREQRRGQNGRMVFVDERGESRVDWPAGDGDHRRPKQCRQKVARDPKCQ
jgi:hypothetical protein